MHSHSIPILSQYMVFYWSIYGILLVNIWYFTGQMKSHILNYMLPIIWFLILRFVILHFVSYANATLMVLVFRSSYPQVFCKRDVLRNFIKLKGKHLCQSLFLIKLQASVKPLDRKVIELKSI